MKTHTSRVIVLTKVEMTGRRPTGEMVLRDCNWFPDFETVPVATALVYSRRLKKVIVGLRLCLSEDRS